MVNATTNDHWSRVRKWGSILVLVCIFSGCLIWFAAYFTEKRSLTKIRETGFSRVNLYGSSLRNALEKYRHLPYVLSRDARIRSLLKHESTQLQVSPHLEDFAHISNTLIFLLDSEGTTVAASNWRTNQDLTGHNFSFRPYYKDAKEGRSGGYYAVGLRTKRPGFFISYPVLEMGRLLGIVVVKVNLETLQTSWKEGGESVIVSDAFGVLFLSSNTEWKYKSLRPLPENTAQRLRNGQYLGFPLDTLQVHRNSIEGGNILLLEGKRYLEQSLQLPEYGWRIHYLSDLQTLSNQVSVAISITTVTVVTLLLCLLYLRERRQKLQSRHEAREARAVKNINERLRQEIRKHKRTEENLRKTQNELIQAGKLAALGRMSAAIAHELNQPVTAIRTFIASSHIFMERQQFTEVATNLGHISKLTERMANLTGQLKTFARKRSSKQKQTDLTEVVQRVLTFLGPQFEEKKIQFTKSIPPLRTAIVLGDPLQVEQVISNLLHNALDALKESEIKNLYLSITIDNTVVSIIFTDSGNGIQEQALDSLFDPFFTTKDIGEGLGLGLSIAFGIVEDMNGTITAENRKSGGARFTITLPLLHNNTPSPSNADTLK